MDYNNGSNMNSNSGFESGYNSGRGQGYVDASVYQAPNGQYPRAEVRCPGKEITCMILGIMSIYCGVFSVLFCWFIMYAFIFGICAIAYAIPAFILRKKAVEQATVTTKKSVIGRNLAIAGLICGIVAMIISLVITVLFGVALGSGLGAFSGSDLESVFGNFLSL